MKELTEDQIAAAAAEEELKEASKAADQLAAAAAEAAPELPKSIVKVGGKKYKFRLPKFRLDGAEVLSEDAALDSALLEKLVAIEGQTILVEQA